MTKRHIERILNRAAVAEQITRRDMRLRNNRGMRSVRARQRAAADLRSGGMTYSEIAQTLGYRTHASALAAARQGETLAEREHAASGR